MRSKKDRKRSKFLDASQAEELFSRVDETGHDNADTARSQRRRRSECRPTVDVDPLTPDDPSGSDVDKKIRRTAVTFVAVTLLVVVLSQVGCSVIRRFSTSSLSDRVNVGTVSMALRNGVEWGDGFTSFPEQFTVQEADENTGRIEVTVTDTSSDNAMDCFSASQIQSTALSINALLNDKINVVIYHVNVHVGDNGDFVKSQFFGFLMPAGEVRSFMTFVWTKSSTGWSCTITGIDEKTTAAIKDKLEVPGAGLLDPTAQSADAATPTTDEASLAMTGASDVDGHADDAS